MESASNGERDLEQETITMSETISTPKVQKTEAEWRELLTPEQFHGIIDGALRR